VSLTTGPLTSNTGGLYKWDVPSSTFGTSTVLKVVFDGSGNSTEYTSSSFTADKS
jgi:hypothetical protein